MNSTKTASGALRETKKEARQIQEMQLLLDCLWAKFITCDEAGRAKTHREFIQMGPMSIRHQLKEELLICGIKNSLEELLVEARAEIDAGNLPKYKAVPSLSEIIAERYPDHLEGTKYEAEHPSVRESRARKRASKSALAELKK